MLEPQSFSPVQMPQLGYLQVPVLDIRVDGKSLGICDDGSCRGVVDTGSSHMGVPSSVLKHMSETLRVDAGALADCRLAKAPTVEMGLTSTTLVITPETYMRQLPLRSDLQVLWGERVDACSFWGELFSSCRVRGGSLHSSLQRVASKHHDTTHPAQRACETHLPESHFFSYLGMEVSSIAGCSLHRPRLTLEKALHR